MKNNFTKIAIFFIFSNVYSQQAIVTIGYSNSGGIELASYSIGQVSYKTIESSTKISEGVQQPIELFSILSNPEINSNLDFSVYPNPCSEFLNIELFDINFNEIKYQIIDYLGKIVIEGNFSNKTEKIQLINLTEKLYILNLIKNNKIETSIKIIKN